jgi:hypothetical protein
VSEEALSAPHVGFISPPHMWGLPAMLNMFQLVIFSAWTQYDPKIAHGLRKILSTIAEKK